MVLIPFYFILFFANSIPQKRMVVVILFFAAGYLHGRPLFMFLQRMSETSIQRGDKVCSKQPQNIQLQYLLSCAILKYKVKLLKLL